MKNIKEWLKTKHVGQAFQPAAFQPAAFQPAASNQPITNLPITPPELRSFTKEDLQAVNLYRRKLPHWELEGSTYFVTFRVHNSLGSPLWGRLSSLPSSSLPSSSLPSSSLPASPLHADLASIVEEALWFGYGERYILDAYVIMPDHAHLLMKPLTGWSLARILQGIKGFTAREINKALGRKGPFWQDENFDHLVRNERDWLDKFTYIHNNPVKAGLVERPQDYPFSSLVTIHSKGRLESLPHKKPASPIQEKC